MNLETAAMCVEWNLDHNKNSFLWGAPGVGKSSIIHQIAEKRRANGKRFGLIDFRALLRDPVDLRGLPSIENGLTRWLVPDDLPQVDRDGDEGIFFLDELNAAPPSMQSACLGLVWDRKVGNYTLPPGWRVVAAGNRQKDRASAQKTGTALDNRFNHIDVDHDVPTFVRYAIDKGLPAELIAFLRWRPNLLHDMKGEGRAFPTPRSWEEASKSLNAPDSIRLHNLEGDVGKGAAAEMEGFLRVYHSLPSIDSVIMDPDGAKVPGDGEVSARYAIASALGVRAKADNFDNILRYAGRMPREFTTMIVVDATRRDVKLTHTEAFAKWARDNQDVTM